MALHPRRLPPYSAPSVVIPAPFMGEATAPEPNYISRGKGQLLTNVLPGRAGKIIQRGAIPLLATLANGSAASIPKWAIVNGDTMFVQINAGTGWATVAVSGLGGIGNPVSISAPAGISSENLEMAWAEHLSYTYTVDTAGTNSNKILQWNPATNGVVKLANAPGGVNSAAYDVASHLSRLFVIGGDPPGGTGTVAINNNTLYWTDPGWDGTDVVTDWQDDVSGLVNKIRIPIAETTGKLLVFDNRLYIIRNNSIWCLYGTAPSNFQLRKVANYGIANPLLAISMPDGIYMLTTSGLVRFDGATTVNMSGELRDVLGEMGVGSGVTFLEKFNDDALMILRTPNVGSPRWLAYQISLGAWCEFSAPAIFSGGLPKLIRKTQSGLMAWGNDGGTNYKIANVNALLTPEAQISLSQDGWDLGTTQIPCSFTTARVPLGAPFVKSQIMRVMVDVLLQCANPSVMATATLTDSLGNTIDSFTVSATSGAIRQRIIHRSFKEAQDVQVTWTLSGPNAKISAFEVGDMTVEFQPTMQFPSNA